MTQPAITTFGPDGEVTAFQPGDEPTPVPADPAAVLSSVGQALTEIPASATTAQMRTALRTLGETITAALEPPT